jgi:hypothetical protein
MRMQERKVSHMHFNGGQLLPKVHYIPNTEYQPPLHAHKYNLDLKWYYGSLEKSQCILSYGKCLQFRNRDPHALFCAGNTCVPPRQNSRLEWVNIIWTLGVLDHSSVVDHYLDIGSLGFRSRSARKLTGASGALGEGYCCATKYKAAAPKPFSTLHDPWVSSHMIAPALHCVQQSHSAQQPS